MKADRRFRIFIIEDSEIYSTMLNYVLSKNKCIDIIVFNNVDDCEKYKKIKPNLIILDHNLNGIEDLSPFHSIKKLFKKVPIIVMSAQEDINVIFKYIEYGATDYVIKNDKSFDLISTVVNSIINGILSPKNIIKQINSILK